MTPHESPVQALQPGNAVGLGRIALNRPTQQNFCGLESQTVYHDMELAIAPPARVAAGVMLDRPLVVTFSTSTPAVAEELIEEGTLEKGQPMALPGLSGIWAFLSLTSPDMQESIAPPRTDLLQGRTADSIHPVYQEQEGEHATIAYATFPELVITQPGQYRIKVNIIDMNT